MMNEFQENLLLSDDAKTFGLGHAIGRSNHFFSSCISNGIDFIAFATAFCVTYSRSRALKMHLNQRKRLYLISSTMVLASSLVGRIFAKRFNDQKDEKQACSFGLDCCEGSVEYYEKMLNRNKILRKVLENGENLIDEEGNVLKQSVRIPFTEYQFFIKNFSLSITERKMICANELKGMIQKLENNDISKTKKEEPIVDKELKIFKLLRLRVLEGMNGEDKK